MTEPTVRTAEQHLQRLRRLHKEATAHADRLCSCEPIAPEELPYLQAWQEVALATDRALHPEAYEPVAGQLAPALADALERGAVRLDINTSTAIREMSDEQGATAFVVRARADPQGLFVAADAAQAIGNRLAVLGRPAVVIDAQVDRGGYWLSMVVSTDLAVADRRRSATTRP